MGEMLGSVGSGDEGRGGDTGSNPGGDGGGALSIFPVTSRIRDVLRGTGEEQTRFLP